MAHKPTLDKHHSHEIVIQSRFFKGRSYLVPGLFCAECNQWICWLQKDFANEITQEYQIDWLPPRKEDKLKLLRQQLAYKEQRKLELRGVV